MMEALSQPRVRACVEGSVPASLWPDEVFDALGIKRLTDRENAALVFELLRGSASLDGEVAECGVYKGTILVPAALLLRELGSTKVIHGFDTFSGFPQDLARDEKDDFANFARQLREGRITQAHYARAVERCERARVAAAATGKGHMQTGYFSDADLGELDELVKALRLQERVRLWPGAFAQTFPRVPAGMRFSLVHLDCDLYESYLSCLRCFYPRVVPGGCIVFDEYYSLKYPGARDAVDEFFSDKPEKPQRADRLTREDGFERWFLLKE